MTEKRQYIQLGMRSRSKSPKPYFNADVENKSVCISISQVQNDSFNSKYNVSKVVTKGKDQHQNYASRSIIDEHSLYASKIHQHASDIDNNQNRNRNSPFHYLHGSSKSRPNIKQVIPSKQLSPKNRQILSNLSPNRMIQQVIYQIPINQKQQENERKIKVLESRITQLHKQKQISILRLHQQNRKLIQQKNFWKNCFETKLKDAQQENKNSSKQTISDQIKINSSHIKVNDNDYQNLKVDYQKLILNFAQLQSNFSQAQQKNEALLTENQQLKNLAKDMEFTQIQIQKIENTHKEIIEEYQINILKLKQQILNYSQKQKQFQGQTDIQADQIINKIVMLEEQNSSKKQQLEILNEQYAKTKQVLNESQKQNKVLKQAICEHQKMQQNLIQQRQQYFQQIYSLKSELENRFMKKKQEQSQTQSKILSNQTCRKCNELMKTVSKLNSYINRR